MIDSSSSLTCYFKLHSDDLDDVIDCAIKSVENSSEVHQKRIILSHGADLAAHTPYLLVLEHSNNSGLQFSANESCIKYPATPGKYLVELAINGSLHIRDYVYLDVYGEDLRVNFRQSCTVAEQLNILEFDIFPSANSKISTNDQLVIEIPVKGKNLIRPSPLED